MNGLKPESTFVLLSEGDWIWIRLIGDGVFVCLICAFLVWDMHLSGRGKKGKTMEGKGGPKCSYTGGKIRRTKGEL